MKDEIKEILNKMEDISYKYTTNWLEFHYKDVKMLYDYITNLQEENDYLKDIVSNTELSDEIKKADKWSKRELYKINYQRLQVNKRLREENEKLKEKIGRLEDRLINRRTRIDKAIEYGKELRLFDNESLEFEIGTNFINILQGSDK